MKNGGYHYSFQSVYSRPDWENLFGQGGGIPEGGGVIYRDAPIKDKQTHSNQYRSYLAKHSLDKDFDSSIYSSDPDNLYEDDVIGYNVLPEVEVKTNYGEMVKKKVIDERTPKGVDALNRVINWLLNAARHPQNTSSAIANYVTRHTPFLRGESGSYVKDLSDSRLSRITPESKNIKSILGNTFIEQDNANTIRPASDFKNAGPDTLLGDRRIPLRRFKLFMGIVGGKLKVADLNDFDDSDIVTPVINQTDLTYALKRQSSNDILQNMKEARHWSDNPPPSLSPNAVNDSISKYNSLSSPVGFVTKDGGFVPMHGLRKDKSLLVSPNGNSMFINNLDKLSPQQDSLVNIFLRNNGGAYPIQLDNGRYSPYYEGPDATYEKYMSSDLFRAPESVWAFGEVE